MEVFAAAQTGAIAHRWQLDAGGEWNKQWAGLGRPGQGADMISVVSNKDGRLEVFAVDDDNRVTHRWQDQARRRMEPRMGRDRTPRRRPHARLGDYRNSA